MLTGEVDAAAVEAGDREHLELDLGHHTEVALAAAHGPEQVGFALRGHLPQFSVSGDHGQPADVVGRVAQAPPQQRALAAPQGVADDTDAGGRAHDGSQAELGGVRQYVVPPDTCLDPHEALLRVDDDALHPPGRDQQAALGR